MYKQALRLLLLLAIGLIATVELFGQGYYIQQANASFRNGRADSTLYYLDQCFDYFENIGQNDSLAYAKSIYAKTLLLTNTGIDPQKYLRESKIHLAKADTISSHLKDLTYTNISSFYLNVGNVDSAIHYCNLSEEILLSAEKVDTNGLGFLYYNLGYAYMLNGQTNLAIETYQKCYDHFEYLYGPESDYCSGALNGLGAVYYEESRYLKALDIFEEIIRINENVLDESNFNLKYSYENLTNCLFDVGNYVRGMKMHNKTFEISKNLYEMGNFSEYDMALVHMNGGNRYFRLDDLKRSISEYKLAETYFLKGGESRQLFLYNNMSDLYTGMDSLEKAQEYLDRSIDLFDKLNANTPEMDADHLMKQASIFQKRKKNDKAIELYRKSIAIRDTVYEEPFRYTGVCYYEIATILKQTNSLDEALVNINQSIDILEEVFVASHKEIIKTGLLKIEILENLNQHKPALIEIERLLENLGINPKTFEHKKEQTIYHMPGLSAIAKYMNISHRLYRESADAKYLNRSVKLGQLYLAYLEDYIRYYESLLAFSNLKEGVYQSLDKYVRIIYERYEDAESMDDFNLLVETIEKIKTIEGRFVLNNLSARSYAGVPDTVVQKEIQLKAEVNYNANQLNVDSTGHYEKGLLESMRSLENFQEEIYTNYPEYFDLKYNFDVPDVGSLRGSLAKEELVALYYMGDSIQLELFFDRDSYAVNEIESGESHVVDLVNGLNNSIRNVLANDWKQYSNGLKEVLGIASQDYNKYIISPDGALNNINFELVIGEGQPQPRDIAYVFSLSNIYETSRVGEKTCNFLSVLPSIKDENLGALVFSGDIIENLQRLFNADVIQEDAATETRVVSNLADYKCIHLSTHGILNEEDPLLSYLYFVSDSLNDGRLELRELYNLSMNADFAVLNACSTAEGKYRPGTGIASLASGFFYSGCKNLITSRWPIDEKSSKDLLIQFYEQVSNNSNINSSLFEAKKKYLSTASKELRHPYYWAGLTPFSKSIESSSGTGFQFLYIIYALFGLALIILALKLFSKRTT